MSATESADPDQQLGLIAAFLNPLAFAASGPTPEEATGAIVRGVTRQTGNEIDEFVTEALRNNLLGLPLDLPSINLARGRDAGIPSLNAARAQIYEPVRRQPAQALYELGRPGAASEAPGIVDQFHCRLRHASADHERDHACGKRAAAMAHRARGRRCMPARSPRLPEQHGHLGEQRLGHATDLDGVTTTGLGNIDLWIGGLAEEKMPFGGMLGSTFNFVFENQLEKLQDGDRFYYLERTAGLAFNAELESNSFAKMIMANTDATHLPGLVFSTPGFTLEVDPDQAVHRRRC